MLRALAFELRLLSDVEPCLLGGRRDLRGLPGEPGEEFLRLLVRKEFIRRVVAGDMGGVVIAIVPVA